MKLSKLLDILLWLLLIVAIAATMTGWAAVMGGCAPLSVAPTQTTGNHIARADEHVERIETEAKDVGGSSGKVIRTEATAARADLSDATKANDETSVLIAKYRETVTAQATTIDAYKQRWFGDQLFFWGRVIIFSALAVYVGWGMLGTVLCRVGILGWGKRLLNALPLANPFCWLARR